jgi:hypothetical protein
MKRTMLSATLLAMIILGVAAVSAEDMPTGPPKEMKQLAFLVGEWDVDMDMNMGDTVENWVNSKGTCTYEYILDGAALGFRYESEFMGSPFIGEGIECYDRESKEWQMSWIDNMAGRLNLYTGELGENGAVFTTIDKWQGQEYLARLSTYDETETTFMWKMEMSMDGGKTWAVGGKATYTKK